VYNNFFIFKNPAINETTKNIVKSVRSQMTIWRMCTACCRPEATNAHSECVIHIALALQRWLHERFSVLHYTYNVCLVLVDGNDLVCEVEISLEVRMIYKDHVFMNLMFSIPQCYSI